MLGKLIYFLIKLYPQNKYLQAWNIVNNKLSTVMSLETNLNSLMIKSSSINLILIKISHKKPIQTSLIIRLWIIKIKIIIKLMQWRNFFLIQIHFVKLVKKISPTSTRHKTTRQTLTTMFKYVQTMKRVQICLSMVIFIKVQKMLLILYFRQQAITIFPLNKVYTSLGGSVNPFVLLLLLLFSLITNQKNTRIPLVLSLCFTFVLVRVLHLIIYN